MKTLEQYQAQLRVVSAQLEVAAQAVRDDMDCRDWSVDEELMAEYKRLFYKQAQLRRRVNQLSKNKLAVAQKSATPNV